MATGSPITWQQIQGNTGVNAGQTMADAVRTIMGATNIAKQGVDAYDQGQVDIQKQEFMNKLTGATTPEALQALQASGALDRSGMDSRAQAATNGAYDARLASVMGQATQEQAFKDRLADVENRKVGLEMHQAILANNHAALPELSKKIIPTEFGMKLALNGNEVWEKKTERDLAKEKLTQEINYSKAAERDKDRQHQSDNAAALLALNKASLGSTVANGGFSEGSLKGGAALNEIVEWVKTNPSFKNDAQRAAATRLARELGDSGITVGGTTYEVPAKLLKTMVDKELSFDTMRWLPIPGSTDVDSSTKTALQTWFENPDNLKRYQQEFADHQKYIDIGGKPTAVHGTKELEGGGTAPAKAGAPVKKKPKA